MRKIHIFWIGFSLLLLPWSALAQQPKTLHAGELQLALKKLNTVGSALYLAAHPDDENTALIAWLGNDRLLNTGYLSLTRGDGGQNLIGPEQRELMGLIRTQELLQARRTDGGEQFFTRANDFGFSKDAKEAKAIWDKEKVLADAVWVIRKFRPDVIINRFPPSREAGHGHHEASAMISEEAFRAAADPKRFPEQLRYVRPWQAKRVVWNAYWRRFGTFSNVPPDSVKYVKAEIGSYNPLLGKSHLVVAAESRSMHKSQGFGAAKPRGGRTDFLQHIAGTEAKADILDDIVLTWERFPNTAGFAQLLKQAYEGFKPEYPAETVPLLIKAYALMNQYQSKDYEAVFWVSQKKEAVKQAIAACLGLWLDANAREYTVAQGDSLEISAEVVAQYNTIAISLHRLELISQTQGKIYALDSLPHALKQGDLFNPKFKIRVPQQEAITQPYWLVNVPAKGLFQVNDQTLIGQPENQARLQLQYEIRIQDQTFTFTRPVTYKWTKPEEGELYRPLEITPAVMVNLEQDAYLFAAQEPKMIPLTIKVGKATVKGEIKLQLPEGWIAEPAIQAFGLNKKEEEITLNFKITPTKNAQAGNLQALVKSGTDATFSLAHGIHRIDYLHIPMQTVFPMATALLDQLDMKITGRKIGYITGAGDEVPQCLRQVGYQVTTLTAKEMQEDLSSFDAIIVGVRAYNTEDRLKFDHDKLMKYVEAGGILVTQYQTSFGLLIPNIGVYPFKIGRERVTVEEAPIRFLKPEHPILNTPNKITEKDFEGWVQERGLYFAQEWNEKYEAIIAAADPGEKDLNGGIIVTEYGKGRFIYTGLAFFRQLPAGVKGAYRLFGNMISK
jgi:LmbE family N-acetylglucosaminyl deacetylase